MIIEKLFSRMVNTLSSSAGPIIYGESKWKLTRFLKDILMEMTLMVCSDTISTGMYDVMVDTCMKIQYLKVILEPLIYCL